MIGFEGSLEMWPNDYDQVRQILAERVRVADRARLAAQIPRPDRTRLGPRLRRAGALVAARIAHRLDECVAREALAQLGNEGSSAS